MVCDIYIPENIKFPCNVNKINLNNKSYKTIFSTGY